MEYENVKGRIYDIQGYAVHDGPGIRTTDCLSSPFVFSFVGLSQGE